MLPQIPAALPNSFNVYEGNLYLAEVLRGGPWVMTSGARDGEYNELKVYDDFISK